MQRSDFERHVFEAYGSLTAPDYSFVEERRRRGIYRDFISFLAGRYEVTDTTDLNNDVALCLFVRGADFSCGIKLSLVGPWALISNEEGTPYASDELEAVTPLRPLQEALRNAGVEVLERSEVEQRILFGPTGECSVNEILFSSDEDWQVRDGQIGAK